MIYNAAITTWHSACAQSCIMIGHASRPSLWALVAASVCLFHAVVRSLFIVLVNLLPVSAEWVRRHLLRSHKGKMLCLWRPTGIMLGPWMSFALIVLHGSFEERPCTVADTALLCCLSGVFLPNHCCRCCLMLRFVAEFGVTIAPCLWDLRCSLI